MRTVPIFVTPNSAFYGRKNENIIYVCSKFLQVTDGRIDRESFF